LRAEDGAPSDSELAAELGLGARQFRRLFKDSLGVTPKQYAIAARRQRLQGKLGDAPSVTRALHDAGFGSSGRFYEQEARSLGMTPAAYRDRGRGVTIRYACARCALGWVAVAATERGVCAVLLGTTRSAVTSELRERFRNAVLVHAERPLATWLRRVVEFVATPSGELELPLDVQGTAFQERVWRTLRGTRPGQTLSYAELAAAVGAPKAVRAVGQACAKNPAALVIPCHRALRSDGTLSGYRWGIARKRALLEREKRRTV
jgi:AraC family transcriptional regulator of adaptative response/methylated-DNA-[protein]-cysteine methyltransferase